MSFTFFSSLFILAFFTSLTQIVVASSESTNLELDNTLTTTTQQENSKQNDYDNSDKIATTAITTTTTEQIQKPIDSTTSVHDQRLENNVATTSNTQTIPAETSSMTSTPLMPEGKEQKQNDDDNEVITKKSAATESTPARKKLLFYKYDTTENTNSSSSSTNDSINGTIVKDLCMDIIHNNETCVYLEELCRDESYLKLAWEITYHMILKRPLGIFVFIIWTIIMGILNFLILFLCTLLKPLRSVLLTRIVSDLRRRYYFTNDAEMRILDNKK